MNYLTLYRVDAAKRLLAETELNNIEISARLGIENAKYFGQIFKKEVGMSPKEYRQTHER